MKIILLHGDHTVKSRDRLYKFITVAKKRGLEIIKTEEIDQSLVEILPSQNLFGTEKLVIVEDLNKVSNKDKDWIESKRKILETNLVFYSNSLLSATAIKKLPKPDKIEEYKLPKEIWSFLDSFFPGNVRNSLKLFDSVVENEPEEFVFAVLAKQVRDMYWAKKDMNGMPYPAWRSRKLRTQANKFDEQKLLEIYSELADLDIKSKTSKADMKDSLEYLIVTRLQ